MAGQGTRRSNATKPKTTASSFSLDDWMRERGLGGERNMEVGGEWFSFITTATPDQLAKFNAARDKGDLYEMVGSLLADPADIDKLKEAFERQKQPIDAQLEQKYLTAIVNFLIAGDVGESSAS